MSVTFFDAEGNKVLLRTVEVGGVETLVIDRDAPSSFESVADVDIPANGTGLLIAADSDRLDIRVTSAEANTVTCRIGGPTTGAAAGDPIKPGGRFYQEGSGALYIYNPDPSSTMKFHIMVGKR